MGVRQLIDKHTVLFCDSRYFVGFLKFVMCCDFYCHSK